MNVLVNATICDKKPTGLGVYTQNILRNIRGRGLAIKALINEEIAKSQGIPAVDIINTPKTILSSRGWKAQLLRIGYLNFKLFKCQNKYDFILNTVPEGSILLKKKKQITVIHDILPIKYKEEYPKSYYYYKYYVPLLLKKSKYIVVPSENTKRDVVSFYNIKEENIFVAHNGYDKNHFFPSSFENVKIMKDKYSINNYFLYIGNMYPHKNLQTLIESFSKLDLKKHNDLKLVIAGDTSHWNYDNIKQKVVELKLENKIKFLNYVSYNDLPLLYSGALGFAYPSVYEGFGLPVIEAMACGTPVITSNNSSLYEISEGAALNVNPLDIGEMTKAMTTILEKKEIRDDLIRKGFKRVEQFSWETTSKVIKSLFQLETYI